MSSSGGAPTSEDIPLPELFRRGREVQGKVEAFASASAEAQAEIKAGCQAFQQCLVQVQRLGLFSKNEERDDIATVDLKYLLVPFYLGELYQQLVTPNRQQAVRLARVHLSEFVRTCDRLGLLPEIEKRAAAREASADPATLRAEKISRFKEKRAAETALADLLAQKKNRLHVAGKLSGGGSGEAQSREEEEEAVEDEEEERRVWLLQIKAGTHRAMDSLAALQKEEELLSNAPKPSEEGGGALDERQKQAEERHKRAHEAVQQEQAGGAAAGKGRTFVSVHTCGHQQPLYGPVSASLTGALKGGEREQLRSQVFRPSHALPEYTVEEAGEYELNVMQTIEDANKAALAESGVKPKGEDESDDEEAEMKARNWDDWKDENPRGQGNRTSKPLR